MTTELKVTGPAVAGQDEILDDAALKFIGALALEFAPRVNAILAARDERQAAIDNGAMPDFLPQTESIRESDWQVGDIPPDLQDRRVEITGPTDRKMIINALNSGAKAFMADCEDSMTPTWHNVIQGQVNLRDAVRGDIQLEANGKHYSLNRQRATLLVRPRGWHLREKHLQLGGQPIPAALVDFGLFLWHNAKNLKANGTGPYFYLPKLESHLEARLWADVFAFAEDFGAVDRHAIKVTVLIETVLAAFEIDEILYELRDYIVGMNCGRWDYIFSFIKKFHRYPEFVLPDRREVTMTTHFLRSYSKLVIKTCHRRGALAIGGMAAQIPVKGDASANEMAMQKVSADKEREVADGHDGTWVAHPGLVPVAMEIFNAGMPRANQLERKRDDVHVTAADLLQVVKGKITRAGLRENINVALQYLAAWLDGNGCVPINHLMEDAATAEISRAQIWQWVHHATGILDEGTNITYDLFKTMLREEMAALREELGDSVFAAGQYRRAAELLDRLTREERFMDFLTTVAYEEID